MILSHYFCFPWINYSEVGYFLLVLMVIIKLGSVLSSVFLRFLSVFLFFSGLLTFSPPSLLLLPLSFQSCPTLSAPWSAAYQAPPPIGFSRQQYWSGVPLPSIPPHYHPPDTPALLPSRGIYDYRLTLVMKSSTFKP